jgi:polysaccharide biosynthesis protein PslG
MPTRLFPWIVLVIVALVASAGLVPASAQSNKYLFNMSMNGGVIDPWHPEPWPTVPFGGLRLWNTGTTWENINPSMGTYDWTQLDRWLAAANQHHDSVLYTFAGVPQWASSNPSDPICLSGPGSCDPPWDLNPDGTGTDQMWQDFITALVQHNHNSTTAHIGQWEMWNEPHNNFYWNGTSPQLVRMVADAYAIIKASDPAAIVLSPTVGWSDGDSLKWFATYIAAGGAKYIDSISCHGYSKEGQGQYGPPENMVKYLVPYRASLTALGLGSMPIWDTEADWGKGLMTDLDLEAAWISRFYVLHASSKIGRLYWFIWNGGPQGGLWELDPTDHRLPGTILKAGIAYGQVETWLVGTSVSTCQQTGTIWTCPVSRTGGYQGLIVWDTSQTCSNGTCGTTQYQFQGNYIGYRTIEDSNQIQISGKSVPIGAKPILLQNQ